MDGNRVVGAQIDLERPHVTIESSLNNGENGQQLETQERAEGPNENIASSACTVCHTAATMCCVGCHNARHLPGSFRPTYYCTRECQVSDWQNHKSTCKVRQTMVDREVLDRIVSLLKSLFMQYRHIAHDSPITSLRKEGDRIIIRERNYEDTRVFYPFPEDLVENFREQYQDIRNMLLSIMTCSDTHIVLGGLVSTLLEESTLVARVEEIGARIHPGPMKWTVLRHRQELQSDQYLGHALWKITLKDRSRWALDLAGAQFGYQQVLVPWEEYRRNRIVAVTSSSDIGSTLRGFQTIRPCPVGAVHSNDQYALASARAWIPFEVGWKMVTALLNSLKTRELSATALLTGMSRENFDETSGRMVGSAIRAGEELKERWEAAGIINIDGPNAENLSRCT